MLLVTSVLVLVLTHRNNVHQVLSSQMLRRLTAMSALLDIIVVVPQLAVQQHVHQVNSHLTVTKQLVYLVQLVSIAHHQPQSTQFNVHLVTTVTQMLNNVLFVKLDTHAPQDTTPIVTLVRVVQFHTQVKLIVSNVQSVNLVHMLVVC